jgi:flagellar basal body rod protein FlgB
MSYMRGSIGMISGVSAVQASNVATPSFEARPLSKASPAAVPKPAEIAEDSVQLSNTGQQHLAASQAKPPVPETVAQVIKSAAEGNIGALSLLIVI